MHLLYATAGRKDAHLLKALSEVGHTVTAIDLPDDALFLSGVGDYDALVLDGQHPRPERVAQYRGANAEALILVVLARADPAGRAAVLRAGADLCVTRPLEFRELNARLEALARRRPAGHAAASDLRLSPAERSVSFGDTQVGLSAREFALLDHLLSRPGEVVSPRELLEQVWGEGETDPELVRSGVARLRRKLALLSAPTRIEAVRGHGYRLDAPSA